MNTGEVLCNLDGSYDRSDSSGNDYQWHVLLLIDLIFKRGYKELTYNKLVFKTIKKYGRNNLSKKIRELKIKCRGEIQNIGRILDLYVKGDPKCFEDINILYKKEGSSENHIYIQVKGTGGEKSNCTPHYVEIYKNFFKNCNFLPERSAFFIIMNFRINNALLKILDSKIKGELSDNYIDFIIKVIVGCKSDKPKRSSIFKLIKSAKKYINNKPLSFKDRGILVNGLGGDYEESIMKMVNIVKNTHFIEHLSFSEIEDLLRNNYDEDYDKLINLAKEKSSRKFIKALSAPENDIYLKYDNTYFQELIKHDIKTSIEDGGFFDIV